MGKDYIIEMENISKVFPGGVTANKNISLKIREGEIHSIVGENGAGKSTLMNILYGLYQQTSGVIKFKGKPVRLLSPGDSIALGLGMVHQHFMLIPKFTVLQNIMLGQETGNAWKIDYKSARQQVIELSQNLGLNVNPDEHVARISVPMQQRVEILKILYRKADILIFDEPTAVLTPQQIDEFCEIMARLREQGKTIIFISHKLDEVMRVSDRISVIRAGEIVETKNVDETSQEDLAYAMVGRDVSLGGGSREEVLGTDILLELQNIGYSEAGVTKLNGVSLELKKGEILAIAGVDGNGQEELVNVICGKIKPDCGTASFLGHDLKAKSVKEIKDLGLATIFEDRHKDGLVLPFSVKQNLILGYQDKARFLKRRYFLDNRAMTENSEKMVKQYAIRCGSVESPISSLSGGNQQKVILAREITADPKVIMAVQPTRGLDLGAMEFVHQRLVDQRNLGKSVLLFSLELDEVLQLADRVAIIFRGEIRAVLENKGLTKKELGLYMLGADKAGTTNKGGAVV